jgi:hypothetical protein
VTLTHPGSLEGFSGLRGTDQTGQLAWSDGRAKRGAELTCDALSWLRA